MMVKAKLCMAIHCQTTCLEIKAHVQTEYKINLPFIQLKVNHEIHIVPEKREHIKKAEDNQRWIKK